MFTIINEMTYDTVMVRTHRPADRGPFLLPGSRWLNVSGPQKSARNYYVNAQGRQAAEMVRNAFDLAQGAEPDLLVVTPFKSVAAGLRQELASCRGVSADWIRTHVGTIDELNGQKANEVLLVLGCDAGAKKAVHSVERSAITAVAASARDRLYVLGDAEVWRESPWVSFARAHLLQYTKKQAEQQAARENKGQTGT